MIATFGSCNDVLQIRFFRRQSFQNFLQLEHACSFVSASKIQPSGKATIVEGEYYNDVS